MLINVNLHYLKKFGLNKGVAYLFHTQFNVPKVSVNCKNIKTMK